jgi:hypothetical protein
LDGAVEAHPTGTLQHRHQFDRLAQWARRVAFDLDMEIDRLCTLDDYRTQITREMDRMVMRVGELLHRARLAHPDRFWTWVDTELPFGRDTAKRLIAIWRAYHELPPEMVARLPQPWQAMFALRNIPRRELEAAMDAGEITPTTTVRQAISWVQARRDREGRPALGSRSVDRLAGALMRHRFTDLDPLVGKMLQRWVIGLSPIVPSTPAPTSDHLATPHPASSQVHDPV